MAEYQTVLFEESADHVATITINRPEAMNSFNRTMMDEFRQIWRHVGESDSIHSVVLRAFEGRDGQAPRPAPAHPLTRPRRPPATAAGRTADRCRTAADT